MGYKVFGVMVDKDSAREISYTIAGDVKAYVQFQQDVPKGIHRLPHWPVEVFESIAPRSPKRPEVLIRKELVVRDM